MEPGAAHPMNPPGIRLGAAPTIRVANKAIIVRDRALLVTVNSGDFATFYLCPGGGRTTARTPTRHCAESAARRSAAT